MTVSLQSQFVTQVVYDLSNLNSSITNDEQSENPTTGIIVDTNYLVVLYMFVDKYSIVGTHGIRVDTRNTLKLNINQCLIASNGKNTNGIRIGGVVINSYSRNSNVNATISSSVLSGNNVTQIAFFVRGTVLATIFNSTLEGYSDTDTQDSNHQRLGARFDFFLNDGILSAYFVQCQIKHNDSGFNIEGRGTRYEATLRKTNFEQNQHGILLGPISRDREPTNGSILVEDSSFQANSGVSLGVLSFRPESYKLADISLNNVTFFNNTSLTPYNGIVQLDGRINLAINDLCTFEANRGTAVQALTTYLTLSGTVVFKNNIAFRGGALSLSYSTLRFRSVEEKNVAIVFENNTATDVGGGIYIDRAINIDSKTGSSCFYDRLEFEGLSLIKLFRSIVTVTLVFRDNMATNGGRDMYGSTLNNCCPVAITDGNEEYPLELESFLIMKYILSETPLAISSDPKRVCLCDSSSQPMCANLSHIFYNTTRYPGEVFSLSLAVVGFNFGMVTGPVYANILPQANNFESSLGNGQRVRQIEHNGCTKLDFTVNSHNSKEIIVLTVNSTVITKADDPSIISDFTNPLVLNIFPIPLPLLVVPVYIQVTLLDCPPGFVRTNKTGRCDCIPDLKEIGINNCSIFETIPYVTHSENQWIQLTSNSNSILTSKYCPFNYCKQKLINVNLNNPDEQCALNHSGTLCASGACLSNLSLAIGSSRCLECPDNNHTALLIAFAAAGILLVLFIKILDLTVTKGTINGLILYANIIWENQSVLFPPQEQTSPLLQFLKVFIAWVNLDFGIETCFIQGLDGYWKTCLQFVFPAYIWLIAGLIILVSHYSTRVTKVIGNNSVSVLSTLFLLAYAKLLRIILVSLEYAILEKYPYHQRIIKWSFDGRLLYFGLEHSILFVIAIAVLLVLWLPYTLTLLLIQPLRRYSHHHSLR